MVISAMPAMLDLRVILQVPDLTYRDTRGTMST